ncbi:hypothetical protein LTR53_000724 [Teratosphaeriaceae sp. CCFEE 6253]|nr:hypothetical protein LTR53_000724 [Teratosphaeriaceae sp. CCFEE 6253]
MRWQDAAAAKQQAIWTDVPPAWHIDEAAATNARGGDVQTLIRLSTNAAELQIVDRGGVELLELLSRGNVSAQEVIAAFSHRAVLAHQSVRVPSHLPNRQRASVLTSHHLQTLCLCENNWLAAHKQARELDTYWRNHRKPVGPLHGLPVSVMDRFHIAGLDSACGFIDWLGNKRTAQDEGTLVRILRSLGAVIHCKTNVPVSLMLGETVNNVIGTTVNPYNLELSAGGACGGEGALGALRGSALGFGTDVAGSSRIPPAFCGLYALKCSEHRLCADGIATVLTGLPAAGGSIGLISNDADLLPLAFESILDYGHVPADPNVLPLPWRQPLVNGIRARKGSSSKSDGRLVFGYMAHDGHVRPHPPLQRALDVVVDCLRKSGHEVIEWKPPPHAPAVKTLFQILGSTSGVEVRTALNASGEPVIPQLQDWYQNQDMEPSSSSEFWALCAAREQYQTQYKAYWNSVGATTRSGRTPDGVILPVAPTLAVRPREFSYYGYSAIANALDYPSGVFPVTTGDSNLDLPLGNLDYLSDIDKTVQQSCKLIFYTG